MNHGRAISAGCHSEEENQVQPQMGAENHPVTLLHTFPGTQCKGPQWSFLCSQICVCDVAKFGISLFCFKAGCFKREQGENLCTAPSYQFNDVFISKVIMEAFKILFSSLILGLRRSTLFTESHINSGHTEICITTGIGSRHSPSAHQGFCLRTTEDPEQGKPASPNHGAIRLL